MRLVDLYCSQEYFDKLAASLGDFARGISKVVRPDKVKKLPAYAQRMAAKQKATMRQMSGTADPKLRGQLRARANRYGTYAEGANLQTAQVNPRKAAPNFDISKVDPTDFKYGPMQSPKEIAKPKRFAWGSGAVGASDGTAALPVSSSAGTAALPVKKKMTGSVPLSAAEFSGAQPWMAKSACPLSARMIQSFRDELEKMASWH